MSIAEAQRPYIARPTNKQDLFFYFFHLPDKGMVGTFEENWQKLARYNFNPKEYSAILQRISSAWRNPGPKKLGSDFNLWLGDNMPLWEKPVLAKSPTFDPMSVVISLNAYATLQIAPSPALLQALEKRFRDIANNRQQLPFNAQAIATTLRAFAFLGIVPQPETQQILKNYLPQIIDTLTAVEHCISLWSLAVLDVLDKGKNAGWERIANDLFNRCPGSTQIGTGNATQYRDAALWFDAASELPSNALGQEYTSRFERDLKSLFGGIVRPSFQLVDSYLPRLDKKTDFCFKCANGKIVHLEADGPYHFILHANNRVRYDGSTQLQTRLMAKLYPDRIFLRLPFATHERMDETVPNKTVKTALLAHTVQQAATYPKGSTLVVQLSNTKKFTLAPL